MHDDLSRFRFALYVRKSNEDKGKQVLSIESQVNEMKSFARDNNLNITKVFKDEGSAHKINNRPGYIEMLDSIQRGKIDGVLAWKADRLSRNMVEGGSLIHLLQNDILKVIQTRYTKYHPTDNMLSLTVELGMANQFSLDLAKNVRRGNKTKTEKGGYCGVAPHGYLNDRLEKTIIPDPERFPLLRKMWDLYLTGEYSIQEICDVANEQWGYRSIKRRKVGGGILRNSTLQGILNNPFYCGKILRMGELYDGNHKPMVSIGEFEKVQQIFRERGIGTKVKQEFPFIGHIHCGECGCAITAERKVKFACPHCRKQLSAKHPKPCRHCGGKISKSDIIAGNWYTYYRCTKKRGKCSQRYISEKQLEKQILEKLAEIDIDINFEKWAIAWLKYLHSENKDIFELETKSLRAEWDKIQKRLDRLFDMKLDGEFDDDMDGYLLKKRQLETERNLLDEKLKKNTGESDDWLKEAENHFDFINGISEKLKNGTVKEKKFILSQIGSNLTIKDGKLSLELKKPFSYIRDIKSDKMCRFEPVETYTRRHKRLSFEDSRPVWYTRLVSLREYFIKNSFCEASEFCSGLANLAA